jgi:hypothetical protein
MRSIGYGEGLSLKREATRATFRTVRSTHKRADAFQDFTVSELTSRIAGRRVPPDYPTPTMT